MKRWLVMVPILGLLFMPPGIASAAVLSPTYAESLPLAIDHAANPAGWTTASLFVIPDGGGAEGLVYDGGKLVVRTATKSRNFKTNYVGQAGYKIYGPATSEAAWVTTGNDATRFLLANGVTGANVTTLLERGLGMDATGTHDAIVEYAVDPQYLLRPTRNPDITQVLPAQYGTNLPFVKPAGMSDAAFANFKAYYAHWLAGAYGPYAFPWTQLGYTFFWGNGTSLTQINGMSEFIILGQSPVDITGIYATGSYIYTRNNGTAFSTAAGASYGNGFASFKIDGTCDTLWAGHRFQKNVRTASGTPNQVIIESNGSLSGGQGLLIWSLNYDVVNNGTISGATVDKYGLAGTANIAVLFKGDTSGAYGTPITTAGAVNRLTNSGTLSSPGTAVKAEAGNTVVINNAGGLISGGVYAIQTGAGDDTVTLNGGEIAGRTDLGAGTDALTVTGANHARFSFTLDTDNASLPQVVNTETVTIADNSATLAVQATGRRNVRSNDRFLIVDATTLFVDPAKLTIDSALPMVAFAAQKTGNQLALVAARNATYYGRNATNPSLGAVLDALGNTASGDMALALGALDRSGDPAGNAAKLEPVVNGGMVQTGFGTAGRFTQSIVNRIGQVLASHDTGSGVTGIAAGDEPAREGVWGQGFGAALRQEPREGSDGYRASLWGSSFGYDRFVFPRLLLGFGGGYGRTAITTGDRRTRTDVDHYQGSLYGSLTGEGYYLDGLLSVAYSQYDAARHIAFDAIDRVAKGDYAGRQVNGYLEGGYTFEKGGFAVTPLLSLQALRLHVNDYRETGAVDLDLTVEAQDYNLFQTGLGAKVAYPIQGRELRITPEFHARWLHDFAGDRQQTTARFAGGGTAFATQGCEPARDSFNVGVKLTLMTKDRVTVSLNYDLERKTDFSGHSGTVHLRYAF
ncbi:MAG: autotransporter domain-containing protein [Deltaproteobacteria bacterium]|nr:autotransporter domain-containing protein [Deltaproteobacteria bacterium]